MERYGSEGDCGASVCGISSARVKFFREGPGESPRDRGKKGCTEELEDPSGN